MHPVLVHNLCRAFRAQLTAIEAAPLRSEPVKNAAYPKSDKLLWKYKSSRLRLAQDYCL